ncbi:MAG: PilZ domain-containing protein [Acidobacteria bacterium]|nr:PilZ domain-containing protein [Acidobacteriota bacterium]
MEGSDTTIVLNYDAVKAEERRASERVEVYLSARWEGDLGPDTGTVGDISIDGCFVLSGGRVAPYELITLEIQLPTDEWIGAWGQVANCTPEIGFGVRYIKFGTREREEFSRSVEYVESLRTAVGALRRLDATVVKREYESPVRVLVTQEQYRALVMLALPKVNKALMGLPECRKKAAIRSSVEAYMEANLAWEAMLGDGAAANRALAEVYQRLQKKYAAHAGVLASLLRRDAPPVLDFLWRRGCIHFTMAS